jgi:hypothetical protein
MRGLFHPGGVREFDSDQFLHGRARHVAMRQQVRRSGAAFPSHASQAPGGANLMQCKDLM